MALPTIVQTKQIDTGVVGEVTVSFDSAVTEGNAVIILCMGEGARIYSFSGADGAFTKRAVVGTNISGREMSVHYQFDLSAGQTGFTASLNVSTGQRYLVMLEVTGISAEHDWGSLDETTAVTDHNHDSIGIDSPDDGFIVTVARASGTTGGITPNINFSNNATPTVNTLAYSCLQWGAFATSRTNERGTFSTGAARFHAGVIVSFGPSAPSDVTKPTIESASIAANGTDLTISYSETVTGSTGITLSASGGAVTATHSSGTLYTLSRQIETGETVTLSYSSGNIQDLAGNTLDAVSDISVTNNSEYTSPDPNWIMVISKDGVVVDTVESVNIAGLEYTIDPVDSGDSGSYTAVVTRVSSSRSQTSNAVNVTVS